jgi:ribosomal-protein-alanine N-acetyltransferase
MFDQTFETFPNLSTKRLKLRQITRHDLDALFTLYGDEAVCRHLDIDTPATVGETIELAHFFLRQYQQRWGIRWGIELREQPGLIGTIGYHEIDEAARRAEIGYDLAQSYWRQGYMLEAARAVIDYGFSTAQLNRIEATANPDNLASTALLLKLGFSAEGIQRKRHYFRGQLNDACGFGLLRETHRQDSD